MKMAPQAPFSWRCKEIPVPLPESDLVGRLFHLMLQHPLSTQEASEAISRARELKLGGVVVPTNQVTLARTFLPQGSETKIVAGINFPNGSMTQPEILFCVTHAESLGADELLLVVSTTAMLDGRLDDVRGLLRQVRKLSRFSVVTVAFEHPLLAATARREFMLALKAEGVTSILPNMGLTRHLTEEDNVRMAQEVIPGVDVTAFLGTSPAWNARNLREAGASRLLSLRAMSLASELV